MRSYEEIKKAMENPTNLSHQELEEMYDEIRELIYDAEHGEKNGLEKYISEIKIYDGTRRGISIHSEPGKLRKKIFDLL